MKDKSIIEKLGITPGKHTVRKRVDNTYDRPFIEYDISEVHSWGSNCIACGLTNPHTAQLYATATQLLEALIEITIEDDENFLPGTPLRAGIDKRIALIESATPKSWEEIKKLA